MYYHPYGPCQSPRPFANGWFCDSKWVNIDVRNGYASLLKYNQCTVSIQVFEALFWNIVPMNLALSSDPTMEIALARAES